MPLPMPRSVMSSPSHITTAVPAVIVMTSVASVSQNGWLFVSGISGSSQPPISWPLRASAMKPVDCSTARPMVR